MRGFTSGMLISCCRLANIRELIYCCAEKFHGDSLVRKLPYEMDVWKYWAWSLLCYTRGSETALRAECWTLFHFLLPLSQKDCSLLWSGMYKCCCLGCLCCLSLVLIHTRTAGTFARCRSSDLHPLCCSTCSRGVSQETR